jgi:CRISPR/Cas system CMR-associated protein Cmr3 (group 5 of RAMP superfamily)
MYQNQNEDLLDFSETEPFSISERLARKLRPMGWLLVGSAVKAAIISFSTTALHLIGD